MDDTETTYQVGAVYTPAAEGGLPITIRRLISSGRCR